MPKILSYILPNQLFYLTCIICISHILCSLMLPYDSFLCFLSFFSSLTLSLFLLNAASSAVLFVILCASVLYKYCRYSSSDIPLCSLVLYIAGIVYVGLSLIACWNSICLLLIWLSIALTDDSSSGFKNWVGTGVLARVPNCAIIFWASLWAFERKSSIDPPDLLSIQPQKQIHQY